MANTAMKERKEKKLENACDVGYCLINHNMCIEEHGKVTVYGIRIEERYEESVHIKEFANISSKKNEVVELLQKMEQGFVTLDTANDIILDYVNCKD
jgi:hypothetical protein